MSYFFWGIYDEEPQAGTESYYLANRIRTHDDEGREIEADGFVTVIPSE